MGLFSKLFHKKDRDDDISSLDIKGHILGEYNPPEDEFGDNLQPPPMLPELKNEGPILPGSPKKTFLNPYRQSQSQNFNEPSYPEDFAGRDLNDTLRIIETQLMAIRAQTETINERLKNLEFALKNRGAGRY